LKNPTLLFTLAVFAPALLGSPVAGAAQEVPPPPEAPTPEQVEGAEVLEDAPPPPGMAELEEARSRMCVAGMARLQEVGAELDPVQQRAFRLEMLFQAVALEDSVRVSPLGDDPLEAAVREWFVADEALAMEHLESEDDEVGARRREARDAVLERIRIAHSEATAEAQEIVGSAEGLDVVIRDCDGAILVRGAVLEACGDAGGPLCESARAEEPIGPFRFVDDPATLWDIEQLRFWSEPSALRPTPDGGLAGARTATMVRRGNVSGAIGVEAMIQSRSAMTPEQAEEFDTNLEVLGFDFDHPAFVMAPAMAFDVDAPGPLGGETHYILHFGDLSDPESDVIWAVPTGTGGPVGSVFPLEEVVLVRLAQGHEVTLTAVRIPEGEGEPTEAVFSLGFTSIGQEETVTALLQYMAGGQLAEDLASFLTPDEPEP